MDWYIYDADGNYVNLIHGSEEFVINLCNENPGWTYAPVQTTPPEPTITPHQQSLINDFNNIQSRIISFIQDHSWATTRSTFELAEKQYDAMVELYLVLADRIRYEGLESYVTID